MIERFILEVGSHTLRNKACYHKVEGGLLSDSQGLRLLNLQ